MRRCSIVMKIGRIVQCYTPIADSATATLESRSTIHRQAERVIFVYVVIEVRYCSSKQRILTRRARRTCTCDSREHSARCQCKNKRATKVNKQTHKQSDRVSDSPYVSSREKVKSDRHANNNKTYYMHKTYSVNEAISA
jgi:hypothetical protein